MTRPPKINREIIDIFRGLGKEENLLLACTDEDMVTMLNDQLFVEHRITYRTFQRYKARAIKELAIPNADPLYIDLINILRMGYVRLRQQLLGAIIKDHLGSKRYMWIMERKFREWNLRAVPPVAEEIPAEELEGPIEDHGDQYPTITGDYYDLNKDERPKDISPVHFALYQGYVLLNPNYDGPEDDNTRAIKEMADMMKQDELPEEEQLALRRKSGAEYNKRMEEKRQQEAAIAAEEAKAPPAGPNRRRHGDKLDAEKARERLLNKIKNHGNNGFYEDADDDDDKWVPYEVNLEVA
ncbi:hypothetical protein BH09BAC1_BH09BAC1_17620 [soil metagenome]